MYRTHYIKELPEVPVGTSVTLAGWVHRRRDHGPITFIDLRNRRELVQVVIRGKDFDQKAREEMKEQMKSESVVQVMGVVQARKPGTENENLATGKIEILASKVNVLNAAETTPFVIDEPNIEAGEEIRMKYRYLDLRRDNMQSNLMIRHQMIAEIRKFLWARDFIEIETPILSKATPEGARDYLVPSRVHPGLFYSLPQSPQQYKQLLMVAGMERYFQIPRCFRDEDLRGDRQPEFTQLDLEMSFVETDDILALTEELFIQVTKVIAPKKHITKIPFPRLTYAEAMDNYGSDAPDLRKNPDDPNELAFSFIVDFPMFEKREDGTLAAMHHPFTKPRVETVEELKSKDPLSILAHQYDLALNGLEVGGGSIRTHDPAMLQATFEVMGHSTEEIREQFGHMLEAFRYGVPPHGGIASGLDRLAKIYAGEENIREVIAFPKNDAARDLMMEAPSKVSPEQLNELSIRMIKK